MPSVKIAINGLGRIGRPVLRQIINNHPRLEVVAVNDLADAPTLAHLLKFDSVYGKYDKAVEISEDNKIEISDNSGAKKIAVFGEKDPSLLPWKDLGVDIVLECTGNFTDYDGAYKHITAGAKRVIISAPSKNPDKIPSYVVGVNHEKFDSKNDVVIDMGSCTTNCLAPVLKILNDEFRVIRGFMSTIHSYTNDQRILDLAHKDLRRARAAAVNIIPTTTGAAKAIGNVIPELKGKLDGIAFRVPTPSVSVLDLICLTEKASSVESVNLLFKNASQTEKLKKILAVEKAPLVSSDYIGSEFSSIVDLSLTMVRDNLIKIIAWYDNEWGYATRLAELTEFIANKS
jgi:glyceraldehyde 3-phosphate dehydrogenase